MNYILGSGAEMIGATYIAYFNLDMQDFDIESGILSSKALPDKDDIKQVKCMRENMQQLYILALLIRWNPHTMH